MTPKLRSFQTLVLGGMMVASLSACREISNAPSIEIKALVGSALGHFCDQAASQFNQSNPQLDDGTSFSVTCDAKGSGDVVSQMVDLSTQFQAGAIAPEHPDFPALLSVDGEIYQNQLVSEISQIFPGQYYVPDVTDSPLIGPEMDFRGHGISRTQKPFARLKKDTYGVNSDDSILLLQAWAVVARLEAQTNQRILVQHLHPALLVCCLKIEEKRSYDSS